MITCRISYKHELFVWLPDYMAFLSLETTIPPIIRASNSKPVNAT